MRFKRPSFALLCLFCHNDDHHPHHQALKNHGSTQIQSRPASGLIGKESRSIHRNGSFAWLLLCVCVFRLIRYISSWWFSLSLVVRHCQLNRLMSVTGKQSVGHGRTGIGHTHTYTHTQCAHFRRFRTDGIQGLSCTVVCRIRSIGLAALLSWFHSRFASQMAKFVADLLCMAIILMASSWTRSLISQASILLRVFHLYFFFCLYYSNSIYIYLYIFLCVDISLTHYFYSCNGTRSHKSSY